MSHVVRLPILLETGSHTKGATACTAIYSSIKWEIREANERTYLRGGEIGDILDGLV
jgi:hypothetical protein